MEERRISRRRLLEATGLGFAGLAMNGLFARPARAGLFGPQEPSSALAGTRAPHFKPRAKRVIFLFMHGGPSQVDTFDWKPLLTRDDGLPCPLPAPRVTFSEDRGALLKSPWEFKQHGQSGAWVSELFPHVAARADDLCFVKSLHGSNDAHGGALLKIHTGSDTFVRPSMGSWVLYGLGTENNNLPGFITICPTLGHGGVTNWSSAFLPAAYQGTPIGNASVPAKDAVIRFLDNAKLGQEEQRRQLDLVQDFNRRHREEHPGNGASEDALDARIKAAELAFRMQLEAPKVLDLGAETAATKELYGIDAMPTDNFGRQCLMARRLAEAGVRFVQCTHSYKWDQHGGLKADHAKNAMEVDKPIAGLLADLKARGLWEDTLVLWGGEFGRTPVSEGGRDGRDHNPHGFTVWMAGGAVKNGFSYGATDDYGFYAAVDKVHVHDLHATLLHILGLDHEQLTYRYAGRDFRLTDVAGKVVKEILA
jgi:hypothetical protein